MTSLVTVNTLPAPAVANLARHAELARGALSPNTERALRSDTALFATWCAEHGLTSLPASPDAVAAYLDDLAQGKATATIRRYVASIAYLHRAAELPDPTKDQAVKLALKRIVRAKGSRQRQASPIGQRELEAMLAVTSDLPDGLRDRALLLTARDLLARRSEVVALNIEDLKLDGDTGTALIRRSKTDQAGQGEVRFLGPDATSALRAWIAAAGITAGAIFRSFSRSGYLQKRLHAGDLVRIFKRMAKRAGLNAAGISGHSCRVGMAQDLVAAGCDLVEVMQAGRWKSASMPARYTERLAARRGAVARYYGVK